jgi:hypothetical protein
VHVFLYLSRVKWVTVPPASQSFVAVESEVRPLQNVPELLHHFAVREQFKCWV